MKVDYRDGIDGVYDVYLNGFPVHNVAAADEELGFVSFFIHVDKEAWVSLGGHKDGAPECLPIPVSAPTHGVGDYLTATAFGKVFIASTDSTPLREDEPDTGIRYGALQTPEDGVPFP